MQKDSYGTQIFCRNNRDFVFQIQPKMNFDARKDYRQAVKFYQTNVAAKAKAGGEGGGAQGAAEIVAGSKKAAAEGEDGSKT